MAESALLLQQGALVVLEAGNSGRFLRRWRYTVYFQRATCFCTLDPELARSGANAAFSAAAALRNLGKLPSFHIV